MHTHLRSHRLGRVLSISIVTVALFGFSAKASAQATGFSKSPEVSVVGGLNIARLSLPLPPGEFEGLTFTAATSSRPGLIGGALVDFTAAPRSGFVTGALISSRGGGMDITIPGFGTASGNLRMIYLDIPALGRFRVAGSKDCDISLLAGGMAGIRLHARSKFSFMGESASEAFTDEVAVFDFGVTIGARVDFGRASVIAYYTHGLMDASGGDAPEPIKHRVASLMAGWTF